MQQAKVWDRFANRYAKKPVVNEEAYQKKLHATREHLKPDMQVLEFGCGTGSTAIAHSPFVKHILAIDISRKMLEIAKGKSTAQGIGNITFKQSGIEEFDATGQRFDVVMGHSILHLLNNRDTVISKVHDLLKPGGVFVSSTTCMGHNHRILEFLLPIGQAVGLLPLVRFFDVAELENSLTAAGFEIDQSWQPAKDSAVFIIARKSV